MKTRRLIAKIHLYGGLACFWYLVIFAISSLHYHHHFPFMKDLEAKVIIRENILEITDTGNDSALALKIQESLGIAGWYVPWRTHRDSGMFYTEIQNPKARYEAAYNPASGEITVTVYNKGFWSAFNSLHGFAGEMPYAPLLVVWKIYTWLCFAVVVFSIISGIWLWAGRGKEKAVGWIIMAAIMVVSFLLMVIIYYRG